MQIVGAVKQHTGIEQVGRSQSRQGPAMESPLTLNPTSASIADGFSASSLLCPSNSGTKNHRMGPHPTIFAVRTWNAGKICAKSVTSRATKFIPSWISPHQAAISAIPSTSLAWENRHRICCRVSHAEEEAAVRIGNHTSKERVDILSEALPFIQKFQGKTVVVKYGGAAMRDGHLRAGVINDLVLLSCVGMRPIFVHGGGPEINAWLGKVGIRPQFKEGLRVTDGATMEVVEMVLVGKVNKSLVSLINRAGGSAVGLCGKDGRLITARKAGGDLGFVGEIVSTNAMVLKSIVNLGSIPVIASVAADSSGQSYNINADSMAGEIAASLGAEKLVLLTDVAGLLLDTQNPRSLVKQIDIKGVKELVDEGKISGGMIPKLNCCVQSIVQGVSTASIIDGRLPHSLLLEILTDGGAGTMIIG